MQLAVSVVVDGEHHVTHQWPVVPPVGSRVLIGLPGTPAAFEAEVTSMLYYRCATGGQGVELRCRRIRSPRGRK